MLSAPKMNAMEGQAKTGEDRILGGVGAHGVCRQFLVLVVPFLTSHSIHSVRGLTIQLQGKRGA